MFGYVRPYKPEMRFLEYDAYKAAYCTLCKQIGRRYGRLLRLTLSYDFTFLALLEQSLKEGKIELKQKRCVANPLKKCKYFAKCEDFTFTAAAGVIMVYYKACDNIADERGLKAAFYRVFKKLITRGYQKAAAEYPKVDALFSEYIAAQNKVEQSGIYNLDAAADPTAQMLGKLFAMCGSGEETAALNRIGYCMGRWIYIMDAAEDLKKDLQKNRYNPLCQEAPKPLTDEWIKTRITKTLNVCAVSAAEAFELIKFKRFKNILGNIIYLGLQNSAAYLLSKEKQKL